MAKKIIKRTELIAAIEKAVKEEGTVDIDEVAETLGVTSSEVRTMCNFFEFDTHFFKPQLYYFTFGQAHFTQEGICMADWYVAVIAKDTVRARELFVEHFTKVHMFAPDKFAFQYKYDELDIRKFPDGEYMRICEIDNNILIYPKNTF